MTSVLQGVRRLVWHVRQNHALEHATMHQMRSCFGGGRLAGCTTASGFFLLGPVRTADVQAAVGQAVEALRGDPDQALHPRCGTNLVALYLLLAALLGLSGKGRKRGARAWIGRVAAVVTAAAFARPVGLWAQRHLTTSGQVDGLQVVAVRRAQFGRWVIHEIATQHDG